MKKIILIASLILCAMVAMPGLALAETEAPRIAQPETLPGPESTKSDQEIRDYFISTFAPKYIGGFIAIMGGIVFLMVVISGIQYLTSYGSEEKMKQATKSLTFSIVGLLLCMLAWSIVSIISTISFGGQASREVGTSGPGTETATEAVQIEPTK